MRHRADVLAADVLGAAIVGAGTRDVEADVWNGPGVVAARRRPRTMLEDDPNAPVVGRRQIPARTSREKIPQTLPSLLFFSECSTRLQ